MKMKKLYKKRFLNKLIILTVLLLAPVTSSAEVGDKKWTKECAKDNKKSCLIAINSQVPIPDSDKKQTLATAIIQLGSTTERKMDLVDGEEKTYKLKEENKLIPILFVNVPLNINLRKKPLILVDKKSILNLNFSHCNAQVGCVTNSQVNDEIIEQFKAGKELSIVMAIYGSNKTKQVKFPLKGFTKSYRSLFK